MRVYADADDLARAARAEVLRRGRACLERRGRFTLALAGGSTPRRLYELLEPGDLDWTRVGLVFGDERCVPPDHADSNYRMVRETLLDRVPVPDANVHRVRGELGAVEAAARYDGELRVAFGLEPGELPALDLVLLGLGADGHTASLFPGDAALEATDRIAVAARSPRASAADAGPDRVSLTFPVLDAAGAVCFLVAGDTKAEVVARVLDDAPGDRTGDELPAARVRPQNGPLIWMLDAGAAARLA